MIEITYGYAGPIGTTEDTTETLYEYEVVDVNGNPQNTFVRIPVTNTIPSKTYHVDADGYNAAEINFKFIEKANYRFKYWQLNDVKVKDEVGPSGFSISLDQELNDNIKVGLRYGRVSDAKTIPYTSASSLSVKESLALAAEFNGLLWNKDSHIAAIAIGRETYNNLNESPNAFLCEIYYRYKLSDYISILPSIQYRKLEGTVNDLVDENSIAYGLRTNISF